MAKFDYDLIVLGAGPGGYIAAIRAAQLGKKVAVVERERLGGVCLNKGCIPTKALLKAAHSVHQIKDFKSMGINVELKSLDAGQAVRRATGVSDRISKGVGFLMKKNKVEVIKGNATLRDKNSLTVALSSGEDKVVSFENLILATGAKYRTFDGLVHDNDRLVGAWEAIFIEDLPKKVGIVGAGAIGMEFAYFWNAFGADVHIFELQDHLLPIEDVDTSIEMEKAYKKQGIKYSLGVKNVKASNDKTHATVSLEEKGEAKTYEFDKVLIAVGMVGNVEGLNLEKVGVKTDRGFISIDDYGKTSVDNIYAIGDVAGPPLLAHVASHEGVIAVEKMYGQKTHPIDKTTIPACTYCHPQVASVGHTEKYLKENKIEYKVGKLPFMANGKAVASEEKSGFVKVLLGKYGELLGAHIVGEQATELIHEYTLFKSMEGTDEELMSTIHPHPTMGEWLHEAVLAANERTLNY